MRQYKIYILFSLKRTFLYLSGIMIFLLFWTFLNCPLYLIEIFSVLYGFKAAMPHIFLGVPVLRSWSSKKCDFGNHRTQKSPVLSNRGLMSFLITVLFCLLLCII